jgi:hypothetical protein
MSPRRTDRRRGLVPAAALAILAHLLALLALGWRVPKLIDKRQADAGPPLVVELVRPPKPARPAVPSSPRAAPNRSPGAAPAPPPPSSPPPALTQPAPTAPPAEVAPPGSEDFRSALRGLVGCSDPSAYRLSREERAACDQRLAAAKPAPVGPQLSAEELAAFSSGKKESIFTRKPHNECLPHIGDRPSAGAGVASRSGATTAFGMACSWSFW